MAEFDLCAAGVAAISRRRWEEMNPDDNLMGAPELVIEIQSPSNRERKLREPAGLCLANGAIQEWVVDPDCRSVSVVRKEGAVQAFGIGSTIPPGGFGGADLPVDEISPDAYFTVPR